MNTKVDDKILADEIRTVTKSLANCTSAKEIAEKLIVPLSMGSMHKLPAEALDKNPMLMLMKMMADLDPDFVEKMLTADLKAICIVVGEKLFEPGELANILEGRRAERHEIN